jgi:hypothetical protein
MAKDYGKVAYENLTKQKKHEELNLCTKSIFAAFNQSNL